MFLQGTIPIQI